MFTAYRGYPPVTTTIDAAREMVGLIRNNEVTKDIRHTLAVTDVISGGVLAFYPGAPGAAASALTVEADSVLTDLENELTSLENNRHKVAASASGIDPGQIQAWLNIILPLLELLRRRRQGTQPGTTPTP
jgi:hypothetical protein